MDSRIESKSFLNKLDAAVTPTQIDITEHDHIPYDGTVQLSSFNQQITVILIC